MSANDFSVLLVAVALLPLAWNAEPAEHHNSTPQPVTMTPNLLRAKRKASASNTIFPLEKAPASLAFKPVSEYEQRQSAEAVQKLEKLKELRGGTNEWVEVDKTPSRDSDHRYHERRKT